MGSKLTSMVGRRKRVAASCRRADERLVPQMQPVEPSHRDGTAPVMRAQVRESSNKLHRHPRTEALKL